MVPRVLITEAAAAVVHRLERMHGALLFQMPIHVPRMKVSIAMIAEA
jgi:uncharacterized protein (DUF779 family)